MRPNQSSITAENNAMLRAHESMRPENECICKDPFAHYFLPDRISNTADQKRQINEAVADWETHFPGVGNAIIARTRFMDDCLQAAIHTGVGQLVILGAGFDTRAMRFTDLKQSVTVFELDHPSTQKKKRARMAAHGETDLSHVRYIPIDFVKDDLGQKLFAGGYNQTTTTLFIWEGVTYYIPPSAVDDTLSFIAHHAPSRSRVLFDYCSASVADGTTTIPEARSLREGLKRLGEEFQFGISPDRIDEFMQARGFRVTSNLTRKDYRNIYFTGVNQSRNVSEMFIFVQAEVL